VGNSKVVTFLSEIVAMITMSFQSLMFHSANITLKNENRSKNTPLSHEITLDLVFFSQNSLRFCVLFE